MYQIAYSCAFGERFVFETVPNIQLQIRHNPILVSFFSCRFYNRAQSIGDLVLHKVLRSKDLLSDMSCFPLLKDGGKVLTVYLVKAFDDMRELLLSDTTCYEHLPDYITPEIIVSKWPHRYQYYGIAEKCHGSIQLLLYLMPSNVQ